MPIPETSLKITIDHAQARVAPERLITKAGGGFLKGKERSSGWSPSWGTKTSSGGVEKFSTYVDPVLFCLMLCPAPELPEWQTTSTGIYARLAKTDITFNDSSLWYEAPKNGLASKYLVCTDSAAGSSDLFFTTVASYEANRPWYLSWFSHNWGADSGHEAELCFSEVEDSGIALRFGANGQCEILIDGQVEETKPYSGKTDTEAPAPAQAPGRFVTVMVFPLKGGLLVVSNQGGGFYHPLSTVAEDAADTDPITPSGKVSVRMYGKAEVELAPIKFPSTAYRSALKTVWLEAPEAGAVPEFLGYYGLPGYGTQSVAFDFANVLANTDFVPDGEARECRIRATLTGDGTSTPYIFSTTGSFAPGIVYTDDSEELDITDKVTALSFVVTESVEGDKVSVTVRHPASIGDDEAALKLDTITMRPAKVEYDLGTGELVPLVDGPSGPPTEYVTPVAEANTLTFDIETVFSILQKTTFSDDFPLDGQTLREAFAFVAKTGPISEEQLRISAEADTVLIASASASLGDYAEEIRRGDKVGTWLLDLAERYVPTWYFAIRPSVEHGFEVWLMPVEELSREPVVTLFGDYAKAVEHFEAEGETWADARRLAKWHTWRDLKKETVPAECNDVWVMGVNRRTLRPILAHYPERESQDATVAPSARVAHWFGMIIKYGIYQPSLTIKREVVRAAKLLRKRLCFSRTLRQWSSELMLDPATLLPVWRGDCIKLIRGYHQETDELGAVTTVEDFELIRVTTLDSTSSLEPSAATGYHKWRPTAYTGEVLAKIEEEGEPKGADGTGGKTMAKTAKAIHAMSRALMGIIATTGQGRSTPSAPALEVYLLPEDDDEDA